MTKNINYCITGLNRLIKNSKNLENGLERNISKFDKKPVICLWRESVKHHGHAISLLRREYSIYSQITRLIYKFRLKMLRNDNGNANENSQRLMAKTVYLLSEAMAHLLHLEGLLKRFAELYPLFIQIPVSFELHNNDVPSKDPF